MESVAGLEETVLRFCAENGTVPLVINLVGDLPSLPDMLQLN